MDFLQRLERAVERGQRASTAKAQQEANRQMSEEECRRVHSQYRIELSEHIEKCMKQLPNFFPGFELSTLVSDVGWGAKVTRDDMGTNAEGKRTNFFSRLEMGIRPFSSSHVLELVAKGTIRNKEVFNRPHYQRLQEADPDSFADLIDLWVLEYAEMYARAD